MATRVGTTEQSSSWSLLPPAVHEDGEIDHDLLFQRITRCLCLLAPLMVITYKTLDACQICNPFIGTILVTTPLPDIFHFVDSYRAEKASARIKDLQPLKDRTSSLHLRKLAVGKGPVSHLRFSKDVTSSSKKTD